MLEHKTMSTDPSEQPEKKPLQQIQHSSVTARVTDAVGQGVFATAAIVLGSPHEFTIDFLQSMVRPSRVAARVVLPRPVAVQFATALSEAIGKYKETFGDSPHHPTRKLEPQADQSNTPSTPPSGESAEGKKEPAIADMYEHLKLPDEMLGGVYANTASITHTASEFCFDFIAQFFPRSVVTARVYMAASRAPELLASLKRSTGMQ